MVDWVSVVTVSATVAGTGIALFVVISALGKKPHIVFSLFNKTEITLHNQKTKEKVTLLTAPVANEKKVFGDTAKKVSGLVLYRVPENENPFGPSASSEIPWISFYGTQVRVNGQLKSDRDIQSALEDYLFDRKERDIPQGRGEYLVVAYGIEKVNKLFLASNPAIEIPLPTLKEKGTKLHTCSLRLEVAGENLKSTVSDGTMIFADSWNNIGVPSEIKTLRTPSRIKNLLIRIGIGRDAKILGRKRK